MRVQNWTVSYPATGAEGGFQLGPLELALPVGRTTALVGPNGSGKTTFLSSLSADVPCSGQLTWDADPTPLDPASRAWLSSIGFVPDSTDELFEELTAAEYWQFLALTRGISREHPDFDFLGQRAGKLAAEFNLAPHPAQPIAAYSLGMKRKTQLIGSLMFSPRLLILDEPRNGLDPFGIEAMHQALRDIAAVGTTVLISSHDLDWVHRFTDHVIGIRAGQLVLNQPMAAFSTSQQFSQYVLQLLGAVDVPDEQGAATP